MSKNTRWFEVAKDEKMEDCLERMKAEGYMAAGRKEEPLFEDKNGVPVPVRQIIKFKGVKTEE